MFGSLDPRLLRCVYVAFLALLQPSPSAADAENTGLSSPAATSRQRQHSGGANSPRQRTFLEPMKDILDYMDDLFTGGSDEDDRHSPYDGRYPPYPPPPPYPPHGGYPPYNPYPPAPIYPPHVPYGAVYPYPPYPHTGYALPRPPPPPPPPPPPHGTYPPPGHYGPPIGYPAPIPIPVPVQPVYPRPLPTYGTVAPYAPPIPTYNNVKPIANYGPPAYIQPVTGGYGPPISPQPVSNYGHQPAPPKPLVNYAPPAPPPKPVVNYGPTISHKPISGYQPPAEVKPVAGYDHRPPPIASYGPTSPPHLSTKTKGDSVYYLPHDDSSAVFNKISQIPSAEFEDEDYDFLPPSKPSKTKNKEKWVWT